MTMSQVDQRDIYGSTALHFAICGSCPPEWDCYQRVGRRIELVGLLLEAEANPLAEDHDGVSAYRMADDRNQREICQMLEEAIDRLIRRTEVLRCLADHIDPDSLRSITKQM